MFIRNHTDEEIRDVTHEGFLFNIPAKKVSWVWDSFGEYALGFLYKNEAINLIDTLHPKTKRPLPCVPPVIRSDEKYWDGVSCVQVRRFQINPKNIPVRNDLILLARKYGVEKDLLDKFIYQESRYDNDEIVKTINALPVPDEVRYPPKKDDQHGEKE